MTKKTKLKLSGKMIAVDAKENEYENMTQEEFNEILTDILDGMNGEELITVPGAFEVFSEYYNNDVLDTWKKQGKRFKFKNLSTEAQDNALDNLRQKTYRGAHKYEYIFSSDSDDYDQAGESAHEFAESCLGFSLDSKRLYFGTGNDRGIGLNGELDLEQFLNIADSALPAAKELGMTATYGRNVAYTGKRILDEQINLRDKIKALYDLAESTGEYADVRLSVNSTTRSGCSTEADATIDYQVNGENIGEPEEESSEVTKQIEEREKLFSSASDLIAETFDSYVDLCTSILINSIEQDIEFRESNESIRDMVIANDWLDDLRFNVDGDLIGEDD